VDVTGTALAVILTWISWYGQSAIRIEVPSLEGTGIVWIDPLNVNVREKADLILVTHPHPDHFDMASINRLRGEKTVIIGPAEVASKIPGALVMEPGQSRDLEWIKIEGVPAYNIAKRFHPRSSRWLGYILTMSGRRIWHAGDTERIPEMKGFKADIALVPLGQTYTMGSVREAADSVLDSGASIAIPIHYGMYEGSRSDADAFARRLAGRVKVEILPLQK
jgi:L-ascorbate metabolism protein UlaG (beta-lactamase superfamily)